MVIYIKHLIRSLLSRSKDHRQPPSYPHLSSTHHQLSYYPNESNEY